jgi:excinuclease ABC subunit C
MRRCSDSVFNRRTRPCILAGIDKCPAPCVGAIDEKAYRAIVEEVADFLQGKNENLLRKLEGQIEEAARSWNFEEAQAKKEKHAAVKRLIEKQHVHEHMGINRDVWGFLAEDGRLKMVVLTFRKGVLIGKRTFRESAAAAPDEELASFLFQYYATRPIPDEIVLSEEIEDKPLLQQYLREKKRGRVRIHGPSDRGAADIVRLAVENLHEVEAVALDEAFRKMLHLSKPPRRIEVYDNSHSHGQNPSGIMVVFEGFKPKKDAYRVFHIREAAPEDDVAMMSEVLTRRLLDERMRPLPDLVVIDGGKAQLAAALGALRQNSTLPVDAISIAKGERRKRMEDVIYLPFRKNPLLLPKSSPVFREIVRMRDEAHRFAVTSHRKWKGKEDLVSELQAIKGVGRKRAMALLSAFPSVEDLRKADPDEIARIRGFHRGLAEEILKALEE